MAPIRVDASHFSPDTRALFDLLHKHGVRYVIVGGEAVIFHGHARLTGDTDLFYGRDAANVERLFAALHDFWSGEIPGIESATELAAPGVIVQFGVPPNRIDLLNEVDGVAFETTWPTRIEALIVSPTGETSISYMGVADLIRNKETAGRPKDLDDLAYLRKARDRR